MDDNIFMLEIWEKKTIIVSAENAHGAVKQLPDGAMFESVRPEGADYKDRLTEYDYCDLCGQPLLQDLNGPVDRWAKIATEPDDCPFGTGIAHELCAVNSGREILEAMRV